MRITMHVDPWLEGYTRDADHPRVEQVQNARFFERVDRDTHTVGPGASITLDGDRWRDLGCPALIEIDVTTHQEDTMPMSFLTVAKLKERLATLPDEAILFTYLGPAGLNVQAEWPDPDGDGTASILTANLTVATGAPAA